MSGLFLLVVSGAWVALLALVAYVLTWRVKDAILRFVVCAIFVAFLLPLPLADEILGKTQFEQLCRENATIELDRDKAAGKTVYLASTPDVEIQNKWLRIVMQRRRYVDINTGEVEVSYNMLQADGGRLAQALPFSEGHVPLTFLNYHCAPKDRPASAQAFEALGIKYIKSPETR